MNELVKEWLAWDKDPESWNEINQLHKENNTKELEKRLMKRLKFGTAGLRAQMGGGNSFMNCLTVIQATQGLAAYLKKMFSQKQQRRGIVIGFDGRKNSAKFARLIAAVFKMEGIYTYLFSDVVPTPWVAFGVGFLKCIAGVMVTASHNTKEYNGFKVFASNAVQIFSPADKEIAKEIKANLKPRLENWDGYKGDEDPSTEIWFRYFANFRKHYTPLVTPSSQDIIFTYTAMHGVGTPFALEAFKAVGVSPQNVVLVERQAAPDADFPTVPSPNPEEGRTVLQLAIETAQRNNSTVILANDPDADRLALGEWNPRSESFYLFSGNEMAALLGWWAVFLAKRQNFDLKTCYFVYSTVSSSILKSIAELEGMGAVDTLTGFKYMGNVAKTMEREDTNNGKPESERRKTLLAFEESIGFMWHNNVYDKDGISALAVFADMSRYLMQSSHQRLLEKLEEIYKTYGYHFTSNSYVKITNYKKVAEMFYCIQKKKPEREGDRLALTIDGESFYYPSTVGGSKVLHVRDLSNGLDTTRSDRRATLPLSKSSPMITFYLENKVKFTLRGSGTEPKLKWYSELITKQSSDKFMLERFVAKVVNELIQPEFYGFIRRKEDISKSIQSKM